MHLSFGLSDRPLVLALATVSRLMKSLNIDPQKNPRPLVLTNEETKAQEAGGVPVSLGCRLLILVLLAPRFFHPHRMADSMLELTGN